MCKALFFTLKRILSLGRETHIPKVKYESKQGWREELGEGTNHMGCGC